MENSKQLIVKDNSMKGANIKVPKLTGKNYLNWKSVMSDLITLKGLQDAVFGSSSDETINLQAKILLKSNLDEAHLAEVREHERAREIWEHLSRMCIGVNSSDQTKLVRRFYNYQYQASDSMATHIEKLTTMRKQPKNVNQDPTDEVFMDRILQTLPSQFERLRENWDYLHSAQQSISQLKARILKVEEDLKNKELKPVAQAFATSDQENASRRMAIDERKKKSRCAKCGNRGHWAKECRTKPENYPR